MEPEKPNEHLSDISTMWPAVARAHRNEGAKARAARGLLLERYRGAVYRYLLGAVRDPHTADELSQEFALRFLRGDFRRADPERGRFRNYLKTALLHLISDYRRAQQRWPQGLPDGDHEPAAPADSMSDDEREFLVYWRREILERTWMALARSHATYYVVLRLRVEKPEWTSMQMAERLAARLDKSFTAERVRQTLHRAHEKFAILLVEEVTSLLESPTPEMVHEELCELDLLRYCRSVLPRSPCGG